MNDQSHNFKAHEMVRYFPDTDSFHVDLTHEGIFTGEELRPDVVTYYDENDLLCAVLIEHASKHPRLVARTLKQLREKLGYTVDR